MRWWCFFFLLFWLVAGFVCREAKAVLGLLFSLLSRMRRWCFSIDLLEYVEKRASLFNATAEKCDECV